MSNDVSASPTICPIKNKLGQYTKILFIQLHHELAKLFRNVKAFRSCYLIVLYVSFSMFLGYRLFGRWKHASMEHFL